MQRWRAWDKLSSSERAVLVRYGLSSEGIEVCCRPGHSSFLVVLAAKEGFHWAYFCADGECRDEGLEDSLELARSSASEAQRLWVHRCVAAGKALCPGYCGCRRVGTSRDETSPDRE